MAEVKEKPIEILLVEDSEADAGLMEEALKEGALSNNNLHRVDNGDAAMEFLHKRGKYRNSPQPDLIMLDLNLPKKDGREVLAEIKQDPILRIIPVVVITTSQSDDDIMKSYDLHANIYVIKPIGLFEFLEVVKEIERFWVSVAKLPPRKE